MPSSRFDRTAAPLPASILRSPGGMDMILSCPHRRRRMSPSGELPASDPPRLTRGQWLLLFVLAALQFMHTVDFVIVMPLAPHLKRGLGIGTQQFGYVVSAYGL